MYVSRAWYLIDHRKSLITRSISQKTFTNTVYVYMKQSVMVIGGLCKSDTSDRRKDKFE